MLDKKQREAAVMRWFWFFMVYSFLGFLLEVLFARVTHHPKRDRKCFYFLPLCPVYGLGALAILALPSAVKSRPLLLILCAAGAATGAEYLVSLFYDRLFHVSFWDYSHLPFHIRGRICLLFSLFWGLLGAVLVHAVHPAVSRAVDSIPSGALIPALLFLALDTGFTFYVLRREGSTDALRWYRRLPLFRPRTS